MKKYRLLIFIALAVLCKTAAAQKKPTYNFRLGATVSFGLTKIAGNNVGIGGLVGVEKQVDKQFTVELEGAYNYFTGDKVTYNDANNKAFAIPVLAGVKVYPSRNAYFSLRTGAIYFLLNDMPDAKIRLAYGIASGINLPKTTNRVNLQLAYTLFQYQRITRGYATLAAAIIIN